jgi:hypothetical protein
MTIMGLSQVDQESGSSPCWPAPCADKSRKALIRSSRRSTREPSGNRGLAQAVSIAVKAP